VKCWGYNGNGQLGDGTFTSNNTPVTVTGLTTTTAIACGQDHTCALLFDTKTVKCWGYNGHGQLGDGTFTSNNKPVSVTGITTATAIACGQSYTCALLTDGTVKCWGYNGKGQLGDGTFTSNNKPVSVTGITTATAIACGQDHTCALLTDGTVKCWGKNDNGQLGDGTFTSNNKPVSVTGLTGIVTAITAGWDHTCALLSDGTVKCWGYNGQGQLGVNWAAKISSNTPVTVTGITTATAIAAGGGHTCALLSDGTMKCWGYNGFGQLGDGTINKNYIPQTVGLLSYTLSTGNNNIDYQDVVGGDAITDINTCAVTCSTTPTCRSFLFNASGLGGAYGSKKCAFKDSKVPGNTLAGASFYSLT